MRYRQIQHNFKGGEHTCKLGEGNLNALMCKLYFFLDKNSENFDTLSLALLPLTVAKLSALKNCCFLAHPVH